MTEAVRRKSYCVILLDEIEKAHPEVFNILLQIFDDGHLTDGKGHRVDFRNSVVVMTSNLGSDLIRQESTIGFVDRADDARTEKRSYERMKEKVMEEVKRFFRPEFLNRIDETVVFHALSKEHILQIVDLMLRDLNKTLHEKGMELEVTQTARELLAEKGYDPEFGARPLRRIIQNEVEDRLSEELLAGNLQPGDTVVVDVEDDEFVAKSKVALASA